MAKSLRPAHNGRRVAAEPVTIFAPKRDPAAVAAVVRELAPDAHVPLPNTPPGVDAGAVWKQIIVPGRRSLLRGRGPSLVLVNDPAYYSEPEWSTQMRGFTAYLLRWPRNERTKEVMSLITALTFAVAIPPEHRTFDLDNPIADDAHARIVSAVARRLDAVLFTPTSLRDADGRVIVSASGRSDPAAVVPNVPAAFVDPVTGRPAVRLPADVTFSLLGPNTEPQPGDADPLPPPPPRVAARVLALAAASARALLEQEDRNDPGVEQARQNILRWVDDVGIRDELEPDEAQLLQLPLGAPERQDVINQTWRVEGLAVLAWALQRLPLPPHDRPVDPGQVLPAVGLLRADRAKALLSEPPLRPRDELAAMQTRLLAIHWRLRDFGLRPRVMNFRKFCDGRTAWLGEVDLAGVQLVGDDLALGDHAIAKAPKELFHATRSAATERHQAINWLVDGGDSYADTDVST